VAAARRFSGGFVGIDTFEHRQPLTVQIPTSLANRMVPLRNPDGGASCAGLVTLTSNRPCGCLPNASDSSF
jgi:hypothetical protein